MDPWLYLRGLAIGFAVAIALGPIGLLVIRRTIDHGWGLGFVSGIGVATADAAYAAIAAFGLTALTSVLVGLDRLLGIVGGLVLVVMAARGLRAVALARTVVAADGPARSGRRRGSWAGAWASMVGFTLANPATILSFAALFASIGAGTGGAAGAALVVAGVFSGSAAWWAILTAIVVGLRARVTPEAVRGLNIVASCGIGAFGIGAVAVGLAAGA